MLLTGVSLLVFLNADWIMEVCSDYVSPPNQDPRFANMQNPLTWIGFISASLFGLLASRLEEENE